ncbi:MAG: disulfide oxidoreductase [bacterium]
MTETANIILSALTMLAQIAIALIVIQTLFPNKAIAKATNILINEHNAILAAFAIALLSTIGSLFYSEIAKFQPCELCWFQRIFMYPQVILLGIALAKKESKIIDYSLGLASVGILFSLYQNFLIYTASKSSICGISAVSCTTKVVLGLGYVTIPLMALTAFSFIIAIFLLTKFNKKN